MRLSVLVSGPGAARLADALRASGRLDVVAAPTEAEARAYLSGTAFDRVLDTSPDGAVAALAGELGVAADRVASDVDPASVLRRLGGPGAASAAASLSDAAPALGGNGRAADAVAELQALGEAISELAHRLNNPVAIVQGNAQLAFELGRNTPHQQPAPKSHQVASTEVRLHLRAHTTLQTTYLRRNDFRKHRSYCSG